MQNDEALLGLRAMGAASAMNAASQGSAGCCVEEEDLIGSSS
jgi:hypothetical protein